MLKNLLARRPFPLHPLFFAVFPILILWAQNLNEGVSFGDIVWPLVVSVAAAAVLTLILTPLFKSARKAGLAATALVFLFFFYGATFRAIRGKSIAGLSIGRPAVVLTILGVLGLIAVVLAARAKRYVPELTRVLNVVGAALVLFNAAQVGYFKAREGPSGPQVIDETNVPPPRSGTINASRRPDIYLLYFDDYAGERTLREDFQFDEEPFFRFLQSRGFYVARQSTANYPRTLLSIAAELNMRYINFLTEKFGTNTGDTTPLKDLTEDHAVGRYLTQKAGYRYIHMGSWWSPTAKSPLASVNVHFGFSEFTRTLIGDTILGGIQGEGFRKREYARALFQIQKIGEVSKLKGPKFVFAHVLVPHGPFVLDRNGNYVTEEQASQRTKERNYVEQVMWVNKNVTRLVDRLLAVPEEKRPVILIQTDEGPYEGEPTRWSRSPREKVLWRKFLILNAMYLPGVKNPPLTQTITPVNTFRLIFDLYFGTKLGLLPDENYAFSDLKKHLYDLFPVTERVRKSFTSPA